MQKNIDILILMGSDSDWEIMSEAASLLESFGVPHEARISSAHRTPDRTLQIVKKAEKKGCKVIIAGAGAAAHLAGVVAGHTLLPVIGVPLNATSLQGIDALLAIVQMPAGIPVASMAIGKTGATNAAIFALQILASNSPEIARQLADYRRKMAHDIESKDERLQKRRQQGK